ncbi:hypothetical protein JGG43_24315, partial [Salmonella enterica subsp. enterica serovar Typhimurium]|nr:hypothetical protein [Salmonella enterica subsp. enterica serovar Typhimurium]
MHQHGRQHAWNDASEGILWPQSTTVTILPNLQDVADAPISARTISRRLGESGLQFFRSLRRLPLTQSHRSQRLQWCRDRASWT